MAQHDYDTNVKAEEEIELLIDINNQQLEILHEQPADGLDPDRSPDT